MSYVNVESILSDLHVKYSIYGRKGPMGAFIKNVAAIDRATNDDVAFCSSDELQEVISSIDKSNAKVILCSNALIGLAFKGLMTRIIPPPPATKQQCLIFVDNPRLAFIRIMNKMYTESNNNESIKHGRQRTKSRTRIEPGTITAAAEAIVSETASIGRNCKIGHFSKIGNNCKLGDSVVIGDRVTVEQNTTIGNNCNIQPGVVIGAGQIVFHMSVMGAILNLKDFLI